MPLRLLRDGILGSEKVNALSWAEEVFYRRLMSVVDDWARYPAHPKLLRAALYPLALDRVSDADVDKWMLATAEAGLVSVYTARDGKRYLEIVNFRQLRRAKRSKWPARVGEEESSCVADDEHAQGACTSDAQQTNSTCSADVVQTRRTRTARAVHLLSKSESESNAKARACESTHTHAHGGNKGISWEECREWTAVQYAEDCRKVRPEYKRMQDVAILQALEAETDPELRARAYCDWKASDLGSLDADKHPAKSLRVYMRNARRFMGRGGSLGGTCDPATDTREVV